MFKRITLCIATTLFFFSCGKDYGQRKITETLKGTTGQNSDKPTETLSEFKGKTEDAFLKIKYDKFDMICNLNVQTSKEADDTITIDLINDYKQTKEFLLKAEVEKRTVEIKFHLHQFTIADAIEFKLDDNQIIKAKLSPKIYLEYRYITYTNEAERLELEKQVDFSNREMLVLERRNNLAVENPAVDEKVYKKADLINCEIKAVIKSQYADQYVLSK